MQLTLQAVLGHPSLARGEPRVLAGAAGLQRRVRWIHSSEVLEIASLLRGGELLLTGGEMLGAATATEQRRYVRDLAERRVTGVAIETGSGLREIPAAVLTEAEEHGFPVVELRRRIPFVDVAEAVNGELVNESVSRLRYGGEVAHALTALLSNGEDLQALLGLLARRTGVPAALFDGGGRLLIAADPADGDTDTDPPPFPLSPTGDLTSRITVRGAHIATLAFRPGPGADHDLLDVVSERACEVIGLALLRSHPPSTRELAASELARLACAPAPDPARLLQLGQVVGFDPRNPVIAIALTTASSGTGRPGLDELLRRHGRVAMDSSDTEARLVLSLPDGPRAASSRTALIGLLEEWARPLDAAVIGVGPVVPRLADAGTSMELAQSAAHQRSPFGPGTVVDATAVAVTTLLDGPELRAGREKFVFGQLAMLLALRPREQETLLQTLETYFDCGCNKTRTAEVLHLQRQSLYGRLERAFDLVGGDPTGTGRALPLHLALRLRERPAQPLRDRRPR